MLAAPTGARISDNLNNYKTTDGDALLADHPSNATDSHQKFMSPNSLLWLVTGSMMLQPLATDLYLASLPHLITDFETTPAAVQQTLTLFVFGFGGAQLISGPLSDRFGRRPTMLAGIAVFIAASIACALAPTLGWLVLARFIQAVGCCTGAVVSRAIVRDAYEPAEGAKILAKASSLFALTPIFGPILGGYLQVKFGWRAAFFAHTVYGVVLFFSAWRWLEETNDQLNPVATRLTVIAANYILIVRNPAFWAYVLPGALSYGSIFVFISGSAYVLIKVLAVPTEYYGYCFAFGVTGYLTGTLICRHLLHRIGMPRTLGVGTVSALLAGLAFFVAIRAGLSHWSVVVGAQFFVMCAHGVNFPCALAGAVAPFPEKAGAAAAVFGCLAMMIALAVGTWVGISQDGTVHPLSATALFMGCVVFATALCLRRREASPEF